MSQLVLEYAKLLWAPQVTIAVVVAGFILVFLLVYRTQIGNRIASGGFSVKGPGGFEIGVAAQRQAATKGNRLSKRLSRQSNSNRSRGSRRWRAGGYSRKFIG